MLHTTRRKRTISHGDEEGLEVFPILLPKPNFTRTITTSTTPSELDEEGIESCNDDESELSSASDNSLANVYTSTQDSPKGIGRTLEVKRQSLMKVFTNLIDYAASSRSPIRNPRKGSRKIEKNKNQLSSSCNFDLPESAELSMNHLLELLRKIIPLHYQYCRYGTSSSNMNHEHDLSLIKMAAMYTTKLDQANNGKGSISRDDEDQIATLLESFVGYPYLKSSCLLVADIHTYVGLLRQSGGTNVDFATISLLKALWIYTHHLNATASLQSKNNDNTEEGIVVIVAEEEDMDRIGLASHRLGLAYWDAGDCLESVTLLRQALQFYERPRRLQYLPQMYNHPLVKAARNDLQYYIKRTKSALLQQSTSSLSILVSKSSLSSTSSSTSTSTSTSSTSRISYSTTKSSTTTGSTKLSRIHSRAIPSSSRCRRRRPDPQKKVTSTTTISRSVWTSRRLSTIESVVDTSGSGTNNSSSSCLHLRMR
ncbi:hypothetical protein FRACYDRAFT_240919 [Fragilariopsis cylindrus CCMP1102]|uniref:Uncharacterized protein n=1 Tax=Fragilariopsis cylindrus CCMP1102 TaxID=635003 RepID=A0A1E7F8C0_9STRA|nr:hypothetical protein FRACYDRAFT_240919 [Fragilariopsis cylindrus CCMP1102]|eukprot:OEU14379.1 hypothetical protein FRACYDRAFT_240919 [Fragilariopsis cylindrus CCMP1102]